MAVLEFSDFDGSGTERSVIIEDEDILTYTCMRDYKDGDQHLLQDGSSFDAKYTFTGLKPGRTTVTIISASPIAPELNREYQYAADVSEDLMVTLTEEANR